MNIREGNFDVLKTDMALGLQKLGLFLGKKIAKICHLNKLVVSSVSHIIYQFCRIKSYINVTSVVEFEVTLPHTNNYLRILMNAC